MKPLICYFLVLTSFTQFIYSQEIERIDSLLNVYNTTKKDTNSIKILDQLWMYSLNNNIDLAKEYANEMVILSQELEYPKGMGIGHTNLGLTNSQISNFKEAELEFQKALDIFRKHKLPEQEVRTVIRMANDYFYQSKYERAIEYCDLAENVLTKPKDSLQLGSVFILKNAIYLEQGYFELSLKYGLRAAKIFKNQKDEIGYAKTCYNIACVHESLGNKTEALQYYYQSIPVFEKNNILYTLVLAHQGLGILYTRDPVQKDSAEVNLSKALELSHKMGDSVLISTSLNEYGRLKFVLKEYESAKETYLESLIIANKMDSGFSKQIILLDLSEVHLALDNYDLALANSMEALNLCQELKIDVGINQAYENLYNIYKEKNDTKNALKYLEKYKQTNDSLYSVDKTNKINELEIQYQTERKEAEIALQEEEIKTLNEKAKVDKLTKGLYAGGMASAIALSGLLVFGFQQRIKKNKIEREKQEEIYRQEIEHKKKELTSQTLHLVQKNTFIQELMENLDNIKNSPDTFKTEFRRMVMLLKKENASDKDWEVFKTYFADVHNDFDQKLRTFYPGISEKEIRLAAFLRMNLTTKEIAVTLNVMPDSVLKSKYRLKKKLGLRKEQDLSGFLNSI